MSNSGNNPNTETEMPTAQTADSSGSNPQPLVSIIIPLGPVKTFLNQALWSITNQTLENWECLIVIDRADLIAFHIPNILRSDSRFKIIVNNDQGIVSALNTGVASARSPFIARFDADDVMFPDRLATQVCMLEARQAVVAVGTQVLIVDANNQALLRQPKFPVHSKDINEALLKKNVLAHPSVMFRENAFHDVGGYRTIFRKSEDYDLWLRLSERGDIFNTPDVHLALRKHNANLSALDVTRDGLYSDLAQVSAMCRRSGNENMPTLLPLETNRFRQTINEMWSSLGQHDVPLRRSFKLRPSLTMKLSTQPFVQHSLETAARIRLLFNRDREPPIAWINLVKKWESQVSAWDV